MFSDSVMWVMATLPSSPWMGISNSMVSSATWVSKIQENIDPTIIHTIKSWEYRIQYTTSYIHSILVLDICRLRDPTTCSTALHCMLISYTEHLRTYVYLTHVAPCWTLKNICTLYTCGTSLYTYTEVHMYTSLSQSEWVHLYSLSRLAFQSKFKTTSCMMKSSTNDRDDDATINQ